MGVLDEWFSSGDRNPNETTEMGYCMLHYAAEHGQVDVVRMLASRGADLNQTGGLFMRAPLHLAANTGHTDAAKMLLDLGAQIDIEDYDGQTAFALAGKRGGKKASHEVRKLLEERGAQPMATKPVPFGWESDSDSDDPDWVRRRPPGWKAPQVPDPEDFPVPPMVRDFLARAREEYENLPEEYKRMEEGDGSAPCRPLKKTEAPVSAGPSPPTHTKMGASEPGTQKVSLT